MLNVKLYLNSADVICNNIYIKSRYNLICENGIKMNQYFMENIHKAKIILLVYNSGNKDEISEVFFSF